MKISQNIAILIPAYNEEKYISQVIKNCASYSLDIVVVDDGSLDKTVEIVKNLQKTNKNHLIFLQHRQNKGKGATLDTGFKHVLKKNYQGVITLDADSQHDTREIKKFLQMVEKEKPDLIIGSRFQNTQGMPFLRLATNYFTSWVISKLAGQRVEDVQSGFRYISKKVIKNIELKTKNFETEPELILKACWLNYKVKNLTIKFFKLVLKSLIWRKSLWQQKDNGFQ
jgi:glycosyltransferase involved in cell wall biosynthesis